MNGAEAIAPGAARERSAGLQGRIAYVVLLLGGTFGGLVQAALTPVLPLAAEHFGGGAQGAVIAQMIATLSGIGIMLGGPLAGVLTQRTGVRNMLLLALGFYALAGATGLFAESAYLLFVSRFIQGMASAGISISASTLIGERFTGNARPRFLGFQGAFLAVVAFLGLICAGQLAEWGGWRAPFILFLAAVPVMGLVLLAGRQLDVAEVEIVQRPPLFASILAMWRLYVLMILLYGAGWMIYLQLPFVLAAEHIKSPAMQSQIIATGTIVHFVGGLLYGRAVRITGTHWMFVLIVLTMGLSDLLVYLAQSPLWVVVACGLAGLAGGNLMIFLTNLLLGRVSVGARPQAIGLMYTAMYIGDFLNPLIGTPLRLFLGNREAFLLVSVLLFGFAAFQMLRGPSRGVGAAGKGETA